MVKIPKRPIKDKVIHHTLIHHHIYLYRIINGVLFVRLDHSFFEMSKVNHVAYIFTLSMAFSVFDDEAITMLHIHFHHTRVQWSSC